MVGRVERGVPPPKRHNSELEAVDWAAILTMKPGDSYVDDKITSTRMNNLIRRGLERYNLHWVICVRREKSGSRFWRLS